MLVWVSEFVRHTVVPSWMTCKMYLALNELYNTYMLRTYISFSVIFKQFFNFFCVYKYFYNYGYIPNSFCRPTILSLILRLIEFILWITLELQYWALAMNKMFWGVHIYVWVCKCVKNALGLLSVARKWCWIFNFRLHNWNLQLPDLFLV